MPVGSKEAEEYLEAMFRRKQKNESSTTTSIAKELGVSPASVSGMFGKLEHRGLVTLKPYHGVELTPEGERIGRGILRKHRLVESFLHVFGIRGKKAHREACSLEHSISEDGERALENAMAGAPMRGVGNAMSLSRLGAGMHGEVVRIGVHGAANRRLLEIGIITGTKIAMIRSGPAGTVHLKARGAEIALSRSIAERIEVVPE